MNSILSGLFCVRDVKTAVSNNIPVHSHDFYELLLLIKGECDYVVDDHFYHALPCDIFLIPPNSLHRPLVQNTDEIYERIVITISHEQMDCFKRECPDITACFLLSQQANNHLVRLYRASWQSLYHCLCTILEEQRHDYIGRDYYCTTLLGHFLLHLHRSMHYQQNFPQENKSVSLVKNVVTYVMANATKNITLEQIADEFFISKYHLAHEFKKVMGTSVYHYIIQRRLVLAKNNILNGTPINEVDTLCGFHDYVSFYRAFKKEFGISPREFKNIHTTVSEK